MDKPMKTVVLDGFTLNPGDLDWSAFKAFGELEVYDRSSPEEALARASSADAVLVNKVKLGADAIAKLPKLRYVGVLATGYDVVDVKAAKARGIPVCNIPEYGTASVAQTVFAHLLNLAQNIAWHAQTVRDGRWSASKDFCYWDYPLIELSGLTLGVVGCGRIGRATAAIGRSFGMRVVGFDSHAKSVEGIETLELDELFRQADVVSLHCPLTPETAKLVDARRLALMKPSAFLINTSRGPLVDEAALAEALNAGRLAGAGLDVVSVEPVKPENPLLSAKNCRITPHIAWATTAARRRLMATAASNLGAFLKGAPVNQVNA